MNEGKFDSWAIVEAMGFKKLAGHVTEQTIAGVGLIRVDVPACGEDRPAFCKLIGPGSIYMITPCDEETARKAAVVLYQDPIPVYIAPERPRLAAPSEPWDGDRDTDDLWETAEDAADEAAEIQVEQEVEERAAEKEGATA